jgi:hypothetical protein
MQRNMNPGKGDKGAEVLCRCRAVVCRLAPGEWVARSGAPGAVLRETACPACGRTMRLRIVTMAALPGGET